MKFYPGKPGSWNHTLNNYFYKIPHLLFFGAGSNCMLLSPVSVSISSEFKCENWGERKDFFFI